MESLICRTVCKIQDQGAAEAVRVREAIGNAIAVLEATDGLWMASVVFARGSPS